MTDSTTTTRVSYTGDGSSASFTITFPFYLATDILVQLAGATVANGYSVSGGNGSTGTLVMATPPAAGVNVQAILNPPLTQSVNLVDGTSFPSATLNQVNDRAVQIGLRLQDQINRTIRAPDGDAAPVMLLPNAANRANKALMLDSNGNITTGVPNTQVITTDLLAPFLNISRTSAEISVGVTPTNYGYPIGSVDRYVNNSSPGVTDTWSGWQAAIKQCRAGGAQVTWGSTGNYLIGTGALDCTFTGSGNQPGLIFRQIAHKGSDLPAGIIVKHNDYCVFDLTGCDHFTFYDLSLQTDSVTYPQTCFLTARNSTGESNLPRFYNTIVTGYFSATVLYNYSSEDGIYVGNYWSNYASNGGDSATVWITANNRLGLTSRFTTIYAGSISCTDHQFIGGQYANLSGGNKSDVFRLDGATGVKISNIWWDCSSVAASGRSYIYVDMTSAPTGHVRLRDIVSEDAVHYPTYGILFGSESTGIPSDWVIDGCYLPNASAPIQVPLGNSLDKFYIRNLTQQASHAMTVGGTLQNSTIDAGESLALTIGTSNHNLIIADSGNVTITTRTNDCLIDLSTGGVNSKGVVYADQGLQTRGAVIPGTPAGATQTGSVYQGSGVPSNTNGLNGDMYFRTDTPGTANQRIYVKSAGAWSGIV